MATEINHDAKSLKDALGVDIEQFEWVREHFVEYTDGKYNFSQVINLIIKKLRKEEFGEDEIEISEYETKLMVASYLWGSYYSLFNFLMKGFEDDKETYGKLFNDLLAHNKDD